MVSLRDLMVSRNGSVDPARFPHETFELYSIPAFDRGQPDLVAGADIGSTKQVVQPGDVLISKIVPHIRRSWIVQPSRGSRVIASSEWIVFRSERVYAPYLRHVLTGDRFHAEFMATVAGVGGSLLRARPAFVADIAIALPPLDEQRRIAEMLDYADALRARRRDALSIFDELTRSIFREMFGRADRETKSWPVLPLSELVEPGDRINYGVLQPGDDFVGGVGLVRVGDLADGRISHDKIKHIDPMVERAYTRSRLRGNEVLVSCVGSIGIVAVAQPVDVGLNVARAVARVPISDPVTRTYVAVYLGSPAAQRYFVNELRTVAQPTLNIKQLAETAVPLPPVSLREAFAKRLAALDLVRTRYGEGLKGTEELFRSLQDRAFRGEL